MQQGLSDNISHCTVKEFLLGKLYPELGGTYHIVSSASLVFEISISGQGFFSGTKNYFRAKMYRVTDKMRSPIYLASGQWSGDFTIHSAINENDVVILYHRLLPSAAPLQIPDIIDQDPLESRNGWKAVLATLKKGDLQNTIKGKNKTGGWTKGNGEGKSWLRAFEVGTEDLLLK